MVGLGKDRTRHQPLFVLTAIAATVFNASGQASGLVGSKYRATSCPSSEL
jgi:hypothetical protein